MLSLWKPKKEVVVGFEEFDDAQGHYSLRADGYVHPSFKGLGIGTSLLRAIEVRAREEMKLAEAGPACVYSQHT